MGLTQRRGDAEVRVGNGAPGEMHHAERDVDAGTRRKTCNERMMAGARTSVRSEVER